MSTPLMKEDVLHLLVTQMLLEEFYRKVPKLLLDTDWQSTVSVIGYSS